MYSSFQDYQIIGMAAAVSSKWDSLLEISDEDEAIVRKFIKKTGVEGRYSASPRQTTSDFCYAAGKKLLEEKGVDPKEIGVLVYVTQTEDYHIPSTACLLQDRLGLSTSTIAFDVNLGCSGFTYGMEIVMSLMNCSETQYGLLLAGDTSAREKSQKRRQKVSHSASMLFGDSGTATLVRKAPSKPILVSSATDGAGYKAIISPYKNWRNPDTPVGVIPGTQMDDIAVFNFATNAVPDQINEYMSRTGTTPEDYDCLVLHQANLMIMKRVGKKTEFPAETVLVSMNRFGNTSSSSIPITLVNEYGEEEGGDRVIHSLCCGFGVGLSWSTVALDIRQADILPLVHTDDFFCDGYNAEDLGVESQDDD